MKKLFTKKFSVVLTVIALATVGCVAASIIISSKKEASVIGGDNVNINQESEVEQGIVLSKEDTALKAEISKFSDTEVDFRNLRQQTFFGKQYNLEYKEIDENVYSKGERRIVYTDSEENVFKYELSTGELRGYFSPSKIITDTDGKISQADAEKTAIKYYESSGFEGYVLTEKENLTSGYSFIFSKLYGNCKTSDTICIWVNFEGEIYNLIISGDDFSDLNVTIDDEELLRRLDLVIKEEGYVGEYTVTEKFIGYNLDEGKESQAVMRFSVLKKNNGYSANVAYMIPLE